MSIEQQLNLKFPIYWGDWPIEREFARYLIYKIVTHRPKNIVELGGGNSSLIILKTLDKLGIKEYNFISIDSDKNFIENTKNLLMAEGVYNEDNVSLLYAPIKDLKINGSFYKWYDKDELNFKFDKIDLLFIDGPIGSLCKNARYPAINVMRKFLKKGSVVIMHDANRPDEIEMVEMWKKEHSDIKRVFDVGNKRGGAEIIF